MSAPAPEEEEVVVETEGVTVRKTFTPDDLPVPAIRFVIESDREAPVDVEVLDTIPKSFSMNRVGFHPEYGADNWTAHQDHRVVYECSLEPEAQIETVYGIRIDTPEKAVSFMTPPDVTVRTESTTDLPVATAEDSRAAKELLTPDTAESPGAGGDPPPSSNRRAIVPRLVAELEADDGSQEDRRALREALGAEPSPDTDPQVSQLESRVEDVAARQASLREDLDRLDRTDETATSADLKAVEMELTQLGQRVEDLENTVDTHSEYELDDIEARLEAATDRLETLEADVSTLRDDVDTIQRWRDRLGDLFS